MPSYCSKDSAFARLPLNFKRLFNRMWTLMAPIGLVMIELSAFAPAAVPQRGQ